MAVLAGLAAFQALGIFTYHPPLVPFGDLLPHEFGALRLLIGCSMLQLCAMCVALMESGSQVARLSLEQAVKSALITSMASEQQVRIMPEGHNHRPAWRWSLLEGTSNSSCGTGRGMSCCVTLIARMTQQWHGLGWDMGKAAVKLDNHTGI